MSDIVMDRPADELVSSETLEAEEEVISADEFAQRFAVGRELTCDYCPLVYEDPEEGVRGTVRFYLQEGNRVASLLVPLELPAGRARQRGRCVPKLQVVECISFVQGVDDATVVTDYHLASHRRGEALREHPDTRREATAAERQRLAKAVRRLTLTAAA